MHNPPPYWLVLEPAGIADLARWALVVLGAIYFVTEASIATPLRVRIAVAHPLLEALIYCPACSGFWLGVSLHRYWGELSVQAAIGSGIAAMALGAAWASWRGAPAWQSEAELRDEVRREATQEEAQDDRARRAAGDGAPGHDEPAGDDRAGGR